MDNNKEEHKEKINEEKNKIEIDVKKHRATKILNICLSLIIIIILFSCSIVYYSVYKYEENHSEELNLSNEKQEVNTVADIISTEINSENSNNAVDNPASNTTVSSGDAENRKILNESIIVLYKGMVLETDKLQIVDLKYIDNSSTSKDDYVITYYNYENYGFKNSTLGVISSQVLDGLVKIDNVGKISISENYNAIPNEIQVINSIPAVVLENNSNLANYDMKKTIIADLDGNGTNEYILILGNKTTGESKILLVESTGLIKGTLAVMNKSGWETVASDGYYLSYNNVEIIDVDNDGIMEILIEMPTTDATPSQVSLLKYKNGELLGNTDVECSLIK